MPKVNINGETHEVSLDDIKLDEGYNIFGPDQVPDGYYTDEAVQQKIQDRLNRAMSKAENKFLDDDSFHKKVLNKYGVLLDDDGKPKGLKPEVDIDEIKTQTAKQISSEWEEKLNKTRSELDNIKKGKKSGDILRAANGLFQEQYVKSYTGNDDPFVVNQFGKMFGVDEQGRTALLDESGEGFAVDGNGNRITPDVYFDKNKDKFSDLLKDNRQRGSGFGGGDTPRRGKKSLMDYTKEELDALPDSEYAKLRKEHGFK